MNTTRRAPRFPRGARPERRGRSYDFHAGPLARLYGYQTLDRGSYDVAGFVRTLRSLHYTGPGGLQCYNLKGHLQENLKRSITAWRKIAGSIPPEAQ